MQPLRSTDYSQFVVSYYLTKLHVKIEAVSWNSIPNKQIQRFNMHSITTSLVCIIFVLTYHDYFFLTEDYTVYIILFEKNNEIFLQ